MAEGMSVEKKRHKERKPPYGMDAMTIPKRSTAELQQRLYQLREGGLSGIRKDTAILIEEELLRRFTGRGAG